MDFTHNTQGTADQICYVSSVLSFVDQALAWSAVDRSVQLDQNAQAGLSLILQACCKTLNSLKITDATPTPSNK